MGTSNYLLYNDRYQGSLSQTQCDKLETFIRMNSEGISDESLRHIIYNLADEDVDTIIQDYAKYGESVHPFERPIGELRDYQTMGVAYAFWAGNFILGDSVGMGKTVEIAGLCNLLDYAAFKEGKKFRFLLLTEKNLSRQVQKEMIKFTGNYVYRIASGEQKDIESFIKRHKPEVPLASSIVGTHALLKTPGFIAWFTQYMQSQYTNPFDLLIIDESSILGGKSSTQIVQGYKALAKHFKRVIFLNATPFESNLNVFYNQLNLLDAKMLPTKTEFDKKYCVMKFNGMYSIPSGKYKNEAEFRQRVGYFYFARTRRDNGAKALNCKGGIIYSPLSPMQKYILSRSQMHRFVFDCPTYLDDNIEFTNENVPKLDSIDRLLKGEFKDAETILMFAYNKETQYYLQNWFRERGIYSEVLNGDTSSKDRDTIIDDFKAQRFRVLITNVQKGLNFGACKHVIFYGFDSNPSKMVQFEGRTTRSFDITDKNIYILCSEGLEASQLKNVVKARAKSTADMTNVDISVVMDILLNSEED